MENERNKEAKSKYKLYQSIHVGRVPDGSAYVHYSNINNDGTKKGCINKQLPAVVSFTRETSLVMCGQMKEYEKSTNSTTHGQMQNTL